MSAWRPGLACRPMRGWRRPVPPMSPLPPRRLLLAEGARSKLCGSAHAGDVILKLGYFYVAGFVDELYGAGGPHAGDAILKLDCLGAAGCCDELHGAGGMTIRP